eukprot:358813-Chlamydomonas_euryale.AAC.6
MPKWTCLPLHACSCSGRAARAVACACAWPQQDQMDADEEEEDMADRRRVPMPPPHVLEPLFKQFISRWSQNGWDIETKQHVFTEGTVSFFRRIIVGIRMWFLSDPWVQVGPNEWRPVGMYMEANSKLYCMRTSSRLESRWAQSNKLESVVGYGRATEETCAELVAHSDAVWTHNRLTRLGMLDTGGDFDLQLLHSAVLLHSARVNASKLGVHKPYPGAPDLDAVRENPFWEEEAQMFG